MNNFIIEPYTKTKFFCNDEIEHIDLVTEEKYTTPKFVMTSQYKAYLAKKREIEYQRELYMLKEKLKAEYNKYHEVDEIDYQRYIAMIQKEYQKN